MSITKADLIEALKSLIVPDTKMREALREEVSWRSNIFWSALSMINRSTTPWSALIRHGKYVVGDCHDMVYGENGESVIVADPVTQSIYEIDKETYAIKWEVPNIGYAVSVDYRDGKTLAVVNNGTRIIEIQNGAIINSMTSGPYGPLSMTHYGGKIEYCLEDPTRFWVAETNRHVVYLTDFAAHNYFTFGTPNVAGSDDLHLNGPEAVSVWKDYGGTTGGDWVWIVDGGNDRLIAPQRDIGTIQQRCPFPGFYSVVNARNPLFIGLASHNYDYMVGTYILDDQCLPMYRIPKPTNNIAFHPEDPYQLLITRDNSIFELDLRSLDKLWSTQYPTWIRIWRGNTFSAGVAQYSRPIPDWLRKDHTIFVKGSQAGTLEIEVARFTRSPTVAYMSWDGAWETWDSVPLTANTLASYLVTRPLGVFRLKVTLNVDGTVYGWVQFD